MTSLDSIIEILSDQREIEMLCDLLMALKLFEKHADTMPRSAKIIVLKYIEKKLYGELN